jgi:hypothetical protein
VAAGGKESAQACDICNYAAVQDAVTAEGDLGTNDFYPLHRSGDVFAWDPV